MDEEEVISVVIDNLTSNSRTDSLSARQGKILNDRLLVVEEKVGGAVNVNTLVQTEGDTIIFECGSSEI